MPTGVSGEVLTAERVDVINCFDNPQAIEPQPYLAEAESGELTLELPTKSVLVLAVN